MRALEGAITNADCFTWNATGSMCGLINRSGGVTVYDVAKNFAISFEPPCSLKGIKAFYFSPLSTYLVAAERFEPKTPTSPNMSLWHVSGKTKIVEGRIRKIAGNSWPSMKWTDDEVCCCRVLAPEDSPDPSVRESYLLQVLNSKTSKTENLNVPGVSLVEVCPGKARNRVAVFIAGNESVGRKPAVKIFDLSEMKPLLTHDFDASIDTCAMRWSAEGSRLLVQAGSEIDESGNSYYGTSKLFLFRVAESEVKAIPHEAPVQDARWSPTGDQFCLISGQTPFAIAMYDKEGEKTYEFAKARKNTIRFSTVKGRFLALGGFGNLAGELEFFDVASKKPFKATRAECTVECQWSPNGRVFMTSSTHPRMRVDNAISLFRYTGEAICSLPFPELYSAKWRPMPAADFPDVPASPRAFDLASKEPEVVKKAYRPPGRDGVVREGTVREVRVEASPSPPPKVEVAPPPPPPPPVPAGPVKMPCPEKDWFYRDPQQVVHGPYTKSVMNSWNKAGYFKTDLPIRAGSVLPFVELTALFPPGQALPFEQIMIIPPAWLNFK